jgi:hypothetical protein
MAARICIAALAGLVAVSLVPATAPAKPCHRHHHSPAGNSESEQYSETVPGACGNQTPGGGGSSNSVPPSTLRQLQALGADGQAAAALAQQTAPSGKVPARERGGTDNGADNGNREGPAAQGGTGGGGGLGSVVDGLTRALGGDSDDGGMGILLPLVLAAVAAAGIGFAILRRRASQAE